MRQGGRPNRGPKGSVKRCKRIGHTAVKAVVPGHEVGLVDITPD